MSNARTLHPEDQIAHYRVVGPLGAGGMGEVYLAQDQSLERSVALKVLPYELTRSDDRVRRFVQEAKSASSLNHPNIVTIYEIGQEPVKAASGGGDSGPLHYISMELISGKTLGAKIHEERTDLKTLVGYLAQAAEGIAKAHAVGIVHRDLKPGNIMISDDGFAKVLDFGLAKLTEKFGSAGPNEATEIADKTSEGAVMGTVSYMSPEQVQGKAVDARADIFSFGCILYEAATRQRPFVAESNVEIMHQILHEKPRPVEELNPAAPAELRRVIRRCLAKQPEQRAQSMKDLAIELREVFDEYDALSASATSATGTATGLPAAALRRRTNMVPILVVVSVIAVAAIAFGWFGLMRGNRETEHPFLNMRVNTQTNRGDVADCVVSPDGRYIAYVAGRANQNTLRVRQVATGSDVEILPVQDASIEFPSFTPDGNYIFYCKRKADAPQYRILMSVPSLGGREQERGFDVDSRLAFSPDSKRACFVRNYPQNGYSVLMMLDLASGKDSELAKIPAPSGPGGPPSWSADGKQIAVCVLFPPPKSSTVIALFDAETGERTDFVTRVGAFMGHVAWLPDGKGLVLSGFDISSSLTNQVFLVTYPEGKLRRVTNDFNNYGGVTVGGSDVSIASSRATALANLYSVDAVSGQQRAITATASPENSPVGIATMGDRVYYGSLNGDFVGVSSIGIAGGEPTAFETGHGHVVVLRAASGRIVLQRIDADQQMHVWRMEPTGGMKQLTSGSGEGLKDLSPDGEWFTYGVADSTRGIWIMSTDGGEGRLIAPNAAHGFATGIAAFTPDSKSVVTIEYETDANGLIRTLFRVTAIEGGDSFELRLPPRATDPEGRPESNMVTFIDAADPNRNVYEMDVAKMTPPRKLTEFTDGLVTDHQWSSDGRRLAVVRRLANGENIWLLDRDGRQPRQATQFTTLDVLQMTWAPDNIHVIASAGQVGNDVVLIRNFQ
jgi:Tol biopolymer transport system component